MQKFLFAVLTITAVSAVGAEFKKDSIAIPAADLKWEQPYGPQGPSIAIASGDAKKGPVSYFMKFTPGYDSGWHTHDSWYSSTVVKGTMTSQGQGDAAAVTLPTGSYFSEPGKKNHKNTCTADSECIIFAFVEKGMTYTPKTADGKAPPKEAPAAPAKKEEGKK